MSRDAGTQPYRHPGRAFVAIYGPPQDGRDVARFADFMRQESGIGDEPPVDLQRIFRHFGMPAPRQAPLSDQQGLLLDGETGLILIKEDDPEVRQRFTAAHELMELLFAEQEEWPGWVVSRLRFGDRAKERLCEEGAAALLMPRSSFLPRVCDLGVTLDVGSALANLYQTSLLAACFRMVRQGSGAHALVVWHYALKPTQVRNQPTADQLSLFEGESVVSPQKELRVWWATCTEGCPNGYIPKHQSIGRDSLIFGVFEGHVPRSGVEQVSLGRVCGTCSVEARCVTIGDERCVLSLLHLPGDDSPMVEQGTIA